MKNRKSLLTLGILALVLVLGVGYAAVTGVTLTLNGEASVSNADLQVYFTAVKEEGSTGDAKVTAEITADTIEADFTVAELELTDEVVLVYTITNKESDVDATLTTPAVTVANEEYYSATATLAETSLGAGESTTLTVKVTLDKTPVAEADNSSEITITLDADPVNNGAAA